MPACDPRGHRLDEHGGQVVRHDEIAVGIPPAVEKQDSALVVDPWE